MTDPSCDGRDVVLLINDAGDLPAEMIAELVHDLDRAHVSVTDSDAVLRDYAEHGDKTTLLITDLTMMHQMLLSPRGDRRMVSGLTTSRAIRDGEAPCPVPSHCRQDTGGNRHVAVIGCMFSL